jgi:hypothetical protein
MDLIMTFIQVGMLALFSLMIDVITCCTIIMNLKAVARALGNKYLPSNTICKVLDDFAKSPGPAHLRQCLELSPARSTNGLAQWRHLL